MFLGPWGKYISSLVLWGCRPHLLLSAAFLSSSPPPPSHGNRQPDGESPQTKAEHTWKSSRLSVSQKDLDAYLLSKFFCLQRLNLVQNFDSRFPRAGQGRGRRYQGKGGQEVKKPQVSTGAGALCPPTVLGGTEVHSAPSGPHCRPGRASLGRYCCRVGWVFLKVLSRPHLIDYKPRWWGLKWQ